MRSSSSAQPSPAPTVENSLLETPSGVSEGLVYADDIGVHITADGSPQTLIDWSSADRNAGIALSPDGTRLAYSRTVKDLWLLDLASGESIPLISPSVRMEHTYILQVTWSPGGDWLALIVGVFHVDGRPAVQLNTLFTMELNTGRVVELESGVNSMAWLPSGEEIAFWIAAGEAEHGLFVSQADGTESKMLLANPLGLFSVSPQDNLLAVPYSPKTGTRVLTLYLVRSDGSEEDLLRDYRGPDRLRAVSHPYWSSDGTRIAFFSWEPLAGSPGKSVSTLFMIDVRTRAVTRLAVDVQPPLAWSPNGQFIAVRRGHSILRVSLEGAVTKWFEVSFLSDGPFEWR
jgi:WD40 repeat protein